MEKIFENLKEKLGERYNETEAENIANLIYHDLLVADQYEECISEDGFDIDLFYQNYEIYTNIEDFVIEWLFGDEELSTEQLISKIEEYGAGLSVSRNEDLTVFIVDKR